MANSRIGNYQLEFALSGFTAPVRSHVHSVYVAPLGTPASGTNPSDIDIQLLGGGTDTLQAVANEYGSYVRTFYATTVSLSGFTLWRYATENSRDFVSAGTLALATSGSGSINVANQTTLTYRTAGGSILKQVFLESAQGGNTKRQLQAAATGFLSDAMAEFVLSSRSPVIGIDNTFPVSPLFDARGENERLWRKIYRQ